MFALLGSCLARVLAARLLRGDGVVFGVEVGWSCCFLFEAAGTSPHRRLVNERLHVVAIYLIDM